jgi:hypothetical protein
VAGHIFKTPSSSRSVTLFAILALISGLGLIIATPVADSQVVTTVTSVTTATHAAVTTTFTFNATTSTQTLTAPNTFTITGTTITTVITSYTGVTETVITSLRTVTATTGSFTQTFTRTLTFSATTLTLTVGGATTTITTIYVSTINSGGSNVSSVASEQSSKVSSVVSEQSSNVSSVVSEQSSNSGPGTGGPGLPYWLFALVLMVLGILGGYYVVRKKGGKEVKNCTALESAYKDAVKHFNSVIEAIQGGLDWTGGGGIPLPRALNDAYQAWDEMNIARKLLAECLGVDPLTIDMPLWDLTPLVPPLGYRRPVGIEPEVEPKKAKDCSAQKAALLTAIESYKEARATFDSNREQLGGQYKNLADERYDSHLLHEAHERYIDAREAWKDYRECLGEDPDVSIPFWAPEGAEPKWSPSG